MSEQTEAPAGAYPEVETWLPVSKPYTYPLVQAAGVVLRKVPVIVATDNRDVIFGYLYLPPTLDLLGYPVLPTGRTVVLYNLSGFSGWTQKPDHPGLEGLAEAGCIQKDSRRNGRARKGVVPNVARILLCSPQAAAELDRQGWGENNKYTPGHVGPDGVFPTP